jgi:CHAT domain-containing protein/tetratricopeptide (TPR) repeat protein
MKPGFFAPSGGQKAARAISLCLVLGTGYLIFALPVLAQVSAAVPENESVEGDRLLGEGKAAYNKGQVAEAARLWMQARAIFTRDLGPEHPNTLNSMGNLALSYAALSRHAEALKLDEETLALRRSKLGPDHPDTLTSMGNLALNYAALGHHAEALRLHEEALLLRRRRLGPDHPDTLTSMSNLALSYAALGRDAEALKLHEETLVLRRSKLGPEHPNTLDSMGNLALSYAALGRHAEALRLHEETLMLMRSTLGPDHPRTLGSMNNLALSYAAFGRHAEALKLHEETLALKRSKLGPEHPSTIGSMNNLANSYEDLGRHAEGLKLHEETLVLMRRKLGPDHPNTLTSMGNMATSYSELGHHAEALRLREEALMLMRSKLGQNHPSTLSSMANLALSYAALGRDADALKLHEQTLALKRSTLGPDHPSTLNSMANLANGYRVLERHVEALKLDEEALALMRKKLGPTHPDTLTSMSNQALSYAALDRDTEALKLSEETLMLRRSVLGQDHPSTLTSMSALALMYKALGRRQESFRLQRQSLELIDRIATSLKVLTRDERSTALSSYLFHYNRFARELANDPTDYAEALVVTERAKARALLEELTARQAIGSSEVAVDAARRLNDLRSGLEFLDGKLASAPNDELRKPLRMQRDAQQAELDTLHLDLQTRYPRYAALSAVKPVTLEQGRALLPEKGVFVSWLLDERASGVAIALPKSGALHVLSADPGQQMSVRAEAYRWLHALPDVDSFAQAVQDIPLTAWQQDGVLYIGAPGKQPADSLAMPAGRYMALRAGAITDHGQWLSDTLLKPLAAQLDSASQWIISPDGVLATIPWDTIPWKGQPLGLQKQITVIQSLSVYKLLKDREAQYRQERSTAPGATQSLLVMGGAEYGTGRGEQRSFQRAAQIVINGTTTAATDYQRQNAFDYMRSRQWPNLPGSLREAEALHRLMEGRKLTGRDASEIKLREISQSGELARYRNLHFAAHGYLDTTVPSLSALVLTASGSGEDKDGYITAGEWPAFNLKSDLLVMSACETGLGKVVSGEGVQGLPYALYVAGNRDTLLSLWQVSDDGTAVFMQRFWAKVKGGQSHALALTETKREFQRGAAGTAYTDPYYWAGFVLYGVQE